MCFPPNPCESLCMRSYDRISCGSDQATVMNAFSKKKWTSISVFHQKDRKDQLTSTSRMPLALRISSPCVALRARTSAINFWVSKPVRRGQDLTQSWSWSFGTWQTGHGCKPKNPRLRPTTHLLIMM
jgi:hypothetical protein